MTPIVIDIESIGIPDVATYLEPVEAPANYKDPEKIAAYKAEAQARQIEMAAVDLDLGQIIAIGLQIGDRAPEVWDAETTAEATMLTHLWGFWRELSWDDRQFVTYAG